MQNLHLADNSNLDKEDKFAKVRPLIDKLNEKRLANYLPEQSVSSYKFWVVVTSLGYAIQFYSYAGKDENYDSSLGLGGSVVVTLAEKLPSQGGSNYRIIMDNFFTSTNLLRILKAKGIAPTGTVRINRVKHDQ